jgi:hypothetical protein
MAPTLLQAYSRQSVIETCWLWHAALAGTTFPMLRLTLMYTSRLGCHQLVLTCAYMNIVAIPGIFCKHSNILGDWAVSMAALCAAAGLL